MTLRLCLRRTCAGLVCVMVLAAIVGIVADELGRRHEGPFDVLIGADDIALWVMMSVGPPTLLSLLAFGAALLEDAAGDYSLSGPLKPKLARRTLEPARRREGRAS